MSESKNLVILFEDNPTAGARIEAAIRASLPTDAELIRFAPKKETSDAAYEDRILAELFDSPYADATLIVSDRDLSATNEFRGLSEAVISKVANRLAIPMAVYASGYTDDLLERQRQFGDARIVVDPATIGPSVAILVSGFAHLRRELPEILKIHGSNRPRSPAGVMAHLLGQPELADQIALYGAGDQKMVSEVLPFAQEKQRRKLEARLPCLLGYWLFDSILRFPGLLVNGVAAASYLNIAVKEFTTDSKIQGLFSSALYKGPFNDSANPVWWRSLLDQLVQAEDCIDGNEMACKLGGAKVAPCKCSVDEGKKAGWYCVATKQPVSLDESQGNISWFPAGADLARIRQDVYDEIGPWLGLY